MNIIFFGEDAFSSIVLNSLLQNNYKVLKVFCPLYKNDRHSRLEKISKINNIPFEIIKDINSEEVVNEIKKLSPDLISVCHFEKIISDKIIKIPKLGCINLHPSLLPKYRGLSPQHWPIINGDGIAGITIHFIDKGIDTGDIILQKTFRIPDNIYVNEFQNLMKIYYKEIVVEAIKLILKKSYKFKVQSNLKGSYFGKLKERDCIIDVFKSSKVACNLIRGVSFPYLGARFENYIIWKCKLIKLNTELMELFESQNKVLIINNSLLYLKFSDGVIQSNKYNILT